MSSRQAIHARFPAPEACIEVRHEKGGLVSRLQLRSGRHLIGRSDNLPISLAHESVSRLHAALVCDPDERWWIHDLRSTNGTRVNGARISKRLLSPGDLVQVGPFQLQLQLQLQQLVPAPARLISKASGPGSAPRLPSAALSTSSGTDALSVEAMSWARSLLGLQERHQRAGSRLGLERSMADPLQSSLLPGAAALEGLDLAVVYEPSETVGGDYVDCVRMPDGRLLLAVADVCGSGLQAALVASSVHTLLHVMVSTVCSLTELVQRMNAHLCRHLPEHSFVTMVYVAIDLTTGEVECVNMGHPAPFTLRSDGCLRALQSSKHPPLGICELSTEVERYRMQENEILLIYTDGLTEPENGLEDALGLTPSLSACLRSTACLRFADIGSIREGVARILGVQRGTLSVKDDVAIVVARLQPRASRESRRAKPTTCDARRRSQACPHPPSC